MAPASLHTKSTCSTGPGNSQRRRSDVFRMSWQLIFVLILIFIVNIEGMSTGVRKCGQLTCKWNEYCSSIDTRCTPCDNICKEDNHNFDKQLCVSECHDYIFAKNVDNHSYAEINSNVEKLQKQVSTYIALTIVCLIILAIILVVRGIKCCLYVKANYKKFSWAWLRQKLQSPKRSSQNKIPKELAESRKPDISCNTVSTTVTTAAAAAAAPQPLSARMLQTTIPHQGHRQAAEDASLDYSYDNMALNLTPSPTTTNTRQPHL